MPVRSFDADADEATTGSLPIPRGIAFRYQTATGRGSSTPVVSRKVAATLPNWDVEAIANLRGWFEARPPGRVPSVESGGRSQPIPLGEFWERLRALDDVEGVTATEPLFLIATTDNTGTIGLRADEFGLWGRPYDNATQEAIEKAREASNWHLKQMNAAEAWDLWKKKRQSEDAPGAGIVVAHPDTGYSDHFEINKRLVLPGHSFIDGEAADASDDLDWTRQESNPGRGRDDFDTGFLRSPGHGTATASVIVSGDNDAVSGSKEIRGVAPGAMLLPLRVSRSVIHFDFANVGKAILHAVKEDADVISMSLGGPLKSNFLRECIAEAHAKGIIVVSAAGNKLPTVVFPAAFPEVVAVAATHAAGEPWRHSGLGRMVDIAAPGEDVWCARTRMTNATVTFESGKGTGTSFATACVAGLAALWLSHWGGRKEIARKYKRDLGLVPFAFQYLLAKTADTSPEFVRRSRHGAGIANAFQLLESDLPPFAEVVRFEKVVHKQSANIVSTLTGLFTGWRGIADDPALDRSSVSLALAASGASGPIEETEAIEQAELERRKEDILLQRFLGEQLKPLDDELLALLAADRFLLIGCQRWRPSESMLPMFNRLLSESATLQLSSRLRRRLEEQRALEEVRQQPLYRGKLEPRSAPMTTISGPLAPAWRNLRVYAFDPSQETMLETAPISQVTVPARWESIQPGPVGEYLEVIDVDPASGCVYAPVDLDHPHILGQNGLTPSEGDPQFHQQMVYAVAMNTIHRFELALGRPMFWAPIRPWLGELSEEKQYYTPESLHKTEFEKRIYGNRDRFVQRLRMYPHALREANAYYSPTKRALLFGYFPGSDDDSGKHFPGGMVFTCLSHDIIVHEMTHALLDGMHPYFNEAGHGDSWAFHEAFADIMALFQHFTYPEVLRHQIAKTRGDLETNNLLGQLAQQFGQATGNREALRSALGEMKDGTWQRKMPDPRALRSRHESHERGSILVAAVFDAFLNLYNDRIADLLRLATGGSGVISAGQIHPDLVNRLAITAAETAEDVLTTCIRALDYLPPVDIVFGEFLRALITADYDLAPSNRREVRVAFIDAFRSWGIYPRDVATLSEQSLRWNGPAPDHVFTRLLPENSEESNYSALRALRPVIEAWQPGGSRKELFGKTLEAQAAIHGILLELQTRYPNQSLLPGIDLRRGAGPGFAVSNLRLARRIGTLGEFRNELVVEVVQTHPPSPGSPDGVLPRRGGATLVIDMRNWAIRYVIYKRLYRRLPDRDAGDPGEPVMRMASSVAGSSASLAIVGQTNWQGEAVEHSTAQLARTYGVGASDAADQGGQIEREPFALLHRDQDGVSSP